MRGTNVNNLENESNQPSSVLSVKHNRSKTLLTIKNCKSFRFIFVKCTEKDHMRNARISVKYALNIS